MQAYLDNNATTKPAGEVVAAMVEVLEDVWGNPSSVHRFGQKARQRVELAREKVCGLLGCSERELIFTSGATESCNLAIRGVLAARPSKRTVVTTRLEHSAVRELCKRLEEVEGYRVVWLPVGTDGVVDVGALESVLRVSGDEVALVAVHWINNETGVVQDIGEIGRLCRAAGVPLLSDGTQAVGKVKCDVGELPIDLMAFSAHKFHGPKGVGGLYVRRRVGMVPQVLGGPHERERRGGTENVPGIVGMGVAAELAGVFLTGDGAERGRSMRDRFEKGLADAAEGKLGLVVNGGSAERLWNTSNVSFPGLESEAILLGLSERGVCAAAGAACSSGSLEPSPVLLAMGIGEAVAHGAVRFSLSRYTTDEEVDYALDVVPEVVGRLRETMPVG